MLKPLQFQAKRREGQATGVSLSEALNSLSVMRNPKRGSARDVLAHRTTSSPSESFVSSRAQLSKPNFTNLRLASQSR